MDLTKEQHHIFCKSQKKCNGEMVRQAFGEESLNRTQKVQTPRPKKDKTGEEQIQEQDHNFL
jgi:hypothetical protein